MPHKSGPFADELEYAFEQIGESTKVTATDPETGLEVSLVAPEGITQIEMKREAAAKLAYVLASGAEAEKSGK